MCYVSIASADSIAQTALILVLYEYYILNEESVCTVHSERKKKLHTSINTERKGARFGERESIHRAKNRAEQKCMTTAPEWQSECKLKPKHFQTTLFA